MNETEFNMNVTNPEESDETPLLDELEAYDSVENSSEAEIPELRFRRMNIDESFENPNKVSPDDKVMVLECKDKDTTCITVTCILREPIASQSQAVVNFKLNANFKDSGKNLILYGNSC